MTLRLGRYRGRQVAKGASLDAEAGLRFAAATLWPGVAKKSPKWLSLAGALVLFQFLDSRAARNRLQKIGQMTRRLETCERVMLIDAKDRTTHHAARGAEFHTHAGSSSTTTSLASSKISHSWQYGTQLPGPTTNAVRRRVEDARGAQVIYPKTRDNSDAGRRGSGMRVLEAGVAPVHFR